MRRGHYIWTAIAVLRVMAALGVAAATAIASDRPEVVVVDAPPPEGSLTPHLASSENDLYLSWLERHGEGHRLRASRWDGTRFGDAHTIHASDRFFANWADFASVLPLADGRLVAHWLEKSAAGTYEYDIWVAISDDHGRSWSEPERPHRDGTLSEHGFVSMVPQGESGFAIVWLDGREFSKDATDNEMSLRFTTHDGGFGEEALLDGRVCECCQTGMAATKAGLFVAYRDRSPEEIRDINYVRFVNGRWTEPATLHADGWQIPGCPVNGPQVAAAGNRVAVAWFTAMPSPRVNVVFSEDGGASFSAPVRIDEGDPVGRVDIEWLDDDVVVSWVERTDDRNAEVRMRSSSPSGTLQPSFVVADTGSGRASGFPRMARFRDDMFVSWTESYDRTGPSRVAVARVSEEPPLLDEPARDFTAEGVDGKTYRLSDLAGKVVLINFWGIWCKTCRVEIPHLIELDRKWRDAGLVVLGADYADDAADLPAFIEETGMTYPVLIDDGLADDYEVIVYPTSYLIDRSGRLRYRVEGYTEEGFANLSRAVERLLAGS